MTLVKVIAHVGAQEESMAVVMMVGARVKRTSPFIYTDPHKARHCSWSAVGALWERSGSAAGAQREPQRERSGSAFSPLRDGAQVTIKGRRFALLNPSPGRRSLSRNLIHEITKYPTMEDHKPASLEAPQSSFEILSPRSWQIIQYSFKVTL
jgi:hypothetical protein